ncbi:MAG TPA: type III-A CRISPR-associated RAMP protein Csm4 [Anaerolineaceae bacterium]
MQIDVWQIQGTAFHLGRHGLGQEESNPHLTSDTLFAAITARLVELKGAVAVQTWMQPFLQRNPPFLISSAFPQAGAIRFYPKPQIRDDHSVAKPGMDPKKLKRIQWVSEKVFLRLLKGEGLAHLGDAGIFLQEGALLLTHEEKAGLPNQGADNFTTLWEVERRPRVTVDRAQMSSNLFFTGRTVFSADCGLWFGVHWLQPQPGIAALFEQLLADLGDAGIGGERTAGFGAAHIKKQGKIDLPDAAGRNWVTLSHYLPAQAEMAALSHPFSTYTIESVGGWVDSPGRKSERRRIVQMLAEGSVFGPLAGLPYGQVVDVQPQYGGKQPLEHPVYRSGLAFPVGFETK